MTTVRAGAAMCRRARCGTRGWKQRQVWHVQPGTAKHMEVQARLHRCSGLPALPYPWSREYQTVILGLYFTS